jgi:hypothetical protein
MHLGLIYPSTADMGMRADGPVIADIERGHQCVAQQGPSVQPGPALDSLLCAADQVMTLTGASSRLCPHKQRSLLVGPTRPYLLHVPISSLCRKGGCFYYASIRFHKVISHCSQGMRRIFSPPKRG